MTCLQVNHFFSKGQKLRIQREADGNLWLKDSSGKENPITQDEANAIVLAVLDGSGAPDFSREACV